jgi:hypothetical protein
MLNEIMLGKETGMLTSDLLKAGADEIIKAYKAIYDKYSDNIFFDHSAMTDVDKAYNEFVIYLRQSNEKKESYKTEDAESKVYLEKLSEFMNKKSNILIDKLTALDSYLQEVSDEEKTTLENTV